MPLPLHTERLAALIEIMAEEASTAQEETDYSDPEDVAFLAMVQDSYSALCELAAWRRAFPDVDMTQVFPSPYGAVALQ